MLQDYDDDDDINFDEEYSYILKLDDDNQNGALENAKPSERCAFAGRVLDYAQGRGQLKSDRELLAHIITCHRCSALYNLNKPIKHEYREVKKDGVKIFEALRMLWLSAMPVSGSEPVLVMGDGDDYDKSLELPNKWGELIIRFNTSQPEKTRVRVMSSSKKNFYLETFNDGTQLSRHELKPGTGSEVSVNFRPVTKIALTCPDKSKVTYNTEMY